jgi:ADP-ribose pyrophosphatase YjhB (NUDIX family)
VLTRGDAVLLVRASARSTVPGRWFLPGGGVEWGEHPDAAVVREVLEETGLEVGVRALLAVVSDVDVSPTEHLHTLRLCYALDLVGGVLAAERAGTSDAVRWVRRGELEGPGVMPFVLRAVEAADVAPG